MCRIIDSVPGSQAAAPKHMTARAAISTPTFGASADSTEPAQKIVTPMIMTRLRPNSSPTMPKASIAPAKVSAYAPTTHCSEVTPACNWLCTLPRTMLTIVLSRNVRNRTRQSTARASERPPRRTDAALPSETSTELTTNYPADVQSAGRPVVLPPFSAVSRPQKLATPTFQVPLWNTAVPV